MVFGLFSRNDKRPRKIVKAEKKIKNMYIQPGDRQYFLDQLRQVGTDEAAAALLKRFTCACENTTVDRDEKELTARMLVDMGQIAVDPIKRYLRHNDLNVNWPFRALRDLISEEALVDFLVDVLEEIGPEYVRDPERKEQLILSAKDYDNEELTRVLLPYLDDDNETIRFVAAEAVASRGTAEVVPALAERFAVESSQRVLHQIADAFVENEWRFDDVEAVEEHLPQGYKIIRNRTLKRR